MLLFISHLVKNCGPTTVSSLPDIFWNNTVLDFSQDSTNGRYEGGTVAFAKCVDGYVRNSLKDLIPVKRCVKSISTAGSDWEILHEPDLPGQQEDNRCLSKHNVMK